MISVARYVVLIDDRGRQASCRSLSGSRMGHAKIIARPVRRATCEHPLHEELAQPDAAHPNNTTVVLIGDALLRERTRRRLVRCDNAIEIGRAVRYGCIGVAGSGCRRKRGE